MRETCYMCRRSLKCQHLTETDDVCVQQGPVIEQLPLHVHVDLRQCKQCSGRTWIPEAGTACRGVHALCAHLCAPLNELGGHVLAGLKVLHEHGDAEVPSAQL